MFDLPRIEAETFVRNSEVHAELASTNDRALELVASGRIVAPLLVLAERQTAGRGRGANRWWSAAGSLTFSLLLSERVQSLPPHRVPQLALTAGLAVCEAVCDIAPGLAAGLKWPNDVYIDSHKKICGILIEVPNCAERVAVVGVGININNTFGDAPAHVRHVATSLQDATGCRFDPTAVLVAVLQRMESNVELLAADPARIQARWRDRCILTGRSICVTIGGKEVGGTCQGIDAHGRLVIATATGEVACASGVVREFV